MTRNPLFFAPRLPLSCRRPIATGLMALALLLAAPSWTFANFIPEIISYSGVQGDDGDPINVLGSNFAYDSTHYVGVIRDEDDGNCALAPATATSSDGASLDLELWGGVHGFHGEFEVQVGELFPLAPIQIAAGTRNYIVFDTEVFEATCHLDAGPYQVLAPAAPLSYQTIPMGQQLWVNDRLPISSGIVRCAILASTPPPCGLLPLDAYGEPIPAGPPTFVAKTKIVQVSGGAPEDEAARASDMAMALNHAFGAFGLQASAQGEWLVLTTPYGLADASFSLVDCGEP